MFFDKIAKLYIYFIELAETKFFNINIGIVFENDIIIR